MSNVYEKKRIWCFLRSRIATIKIISDSIGALHICLLTFVDYKPEWFEIKTQLMGVLSVKMSANDQFFLCGFCGCAIFFVNFVLARCFACTCCFLQSFNLVSQTKDQIGFFECCEWYKVFNFACKLACDFLALILWDFIYKNCYYLPIFEFFVVVTHCQLNIRLIGAEK